MRLLVTGARAPVAVEIARLLLAAGHQVHTADSGPFDLAGGVRGVRRHRLPPPRQQPAAFARAVAELVAREGIERVIPTCEEVFYLAAAREQGHALPLFAPGFETLRRLHDKHAFITLAAGLGLPVPHTQLLESREQAMALAPLARDLVFKPAFSRFGTETLVGERPDRVSPTPQRPWVAQERLQGEEFCLYAVASAGRLDAFCAYRPLYRLGRASSFYFEPVAAPDGEALVRRVTGALAYTGQIAFDAIRTPDGRLLPIECNPRATSGVHLLAGTPGFAACLTGEAQAGALAAPDGPAMLGLAMVLIALPRQRFGRIGAWRRDHARARDVLAGFKGRTLGTLAQQVLESARRRVPLRAIATHDIEWGGEPIDMRG
ncbi:hypothetical protein GCM10007874_53250 [Labrys miyagiensis]|uniref:ATP-grasp domain-containing protein n=1 Tax=Labrys miyagiensis TaxID=346912 RepID=A0ABQ6CPN6_9HYPH|nr:hypothetical protein [Labrys miyagiensis]GLS22307.1 hypothetical protein GCM10007874_53250 [Labrys miyagiensis]